MRDCVIVPHVARRAELAQVQRALVAMHRRRDESVDAANQRVALLSRSKVTQHYARARSIAATIKALPMAFLRVKRLQFHKLVIDEALYTADLLWAQAGDVGHGTLAERERLKIGIKNHLEPPRHVLMQLLLRDLLIAAKACLT